MAGFRLVDEREVHRGSLITVGIGRFEGPDGDRFERDLVHHPGAVSVVPVDGDEVVLVRQYRAALDRDLLEIPAGKRDVPGEPVEETAQRELAEEVGLRAGRLVKVAEFFNSAGFSDELSHVFLGTELEPAERDVQSHEEAHMTIERVRLDDVPRLIAERELIDAKTIIGLLLAREHFGR